MKFHECSHKGQEGWSLLSKKNKWDCFLELGARQCRFPHPLCLLSADLLYYAAVFIDGGGMDATHIQRLICTAQWCFFFFLNPVIAKRW